MIKKKKKKFRKFWNVTLDILEFVSVTGEHFIGSFNPRELKKQLRDDGYEVTKIFDYLRSLEQRGYLEIANQDKKYSIKLTEKGKIKLLEKDTELVKDDCWRMVSYDIPEKIRVIRDMFRSALKRLGFRQVQKSLWASPFVKSDEIEKVISDLGIGQYVAFMLVKKTDIEKHLNNLFADLNFDD